MTNLDIVRDAIDDLERQTITFAIAAKLADLYVIRDHMEGVRIPAKVQEVIEEVESGTEFMQAVKVAGADKAWRVMDELMNTLQAINKRLYDGVIRQLTKM